MKRIVLKNRSSKTRNQLIIWAIMTGAFLGMVIYEGFLDDDTSPGATFSLIWWSVLLVLEITIPLIIFTYVRPYKVVLDDNGITLASVFRKRTIPGGDLKEAYDWGRRENRRGERVIYYADKRYDMHWLSIEVQDRIIEEFRIPVIKKR